MFGCSECVHFQVWNTCSHLKLVFLVFCLRQMLISVADVPNVCDKGFLWFPVLNIQQTTKVGQYTEIPFFRERAQFFSGPEGYRRNIDQNRNPQLDPLHVSLRMTDGRTLLTRKCLGFAGQRQRAEVDPEELGRWSDRGGDWRHDCRRGHWRLRMGGLWR